MYTYKAIPKFFVVGDRIKQRGHRQGGGVEQLNKAREKKEDKKKKEEEEGEERRGRKKTKRILISLNR